MNIPWIPMTNNIPCSGDFCTVTIMDYIPQAPGKIVPVLVRHLQTNPQGTMSATEVNNVLLKFVP